MIVDDEELQVLAVAEAVSKADPSAELHTFDDPFDALEYANSNRVDVAFLDIQMPGMTGIVLAKGIKKHNPKANVVFCTGYSRYALEAMELHASGYLTKPFRADDIRKELENLRFPVEAATSSQSSRVVIRCFGSFEVFVDGDPVKFQLEKTKEMFAYLVDRKGATCTSAEICTALWEDDNDHTSYFQKLRNDLKDTLAMVDCEDIVSIGWGKIALHKEKVACDYYDWLDGKVAGINAYHGEYMSKYSWAEVTNAILFGDEK